MSITNGIIFSRPSFTLVRTTQIIMSGIHPIKITAEIRLFLCIIAFHYAFGPQRKNELAKENINPRIYMMANLMTSPLRTLMINPDEIIDNKNPMQTHPAQH